MRTKSICRLRRTCRSYNKFISAYHKQLKNVMAIEHLGFLNTRPAETDWRKVAVISNRLLNTYYGFPFNFQVDDLCRLQIRSIELTVSETSPAWMEGALRDLRGRVHTRELSCFFRSSYSEKVFAHILETIRPLEVCLGWRADGSSPARDFLACGALQPITSIEITGAVGTLNFHCCHPGLRYLKVSAYTVNSPGEWDGLLLQISQAIKRTDLIRIHVTVVPPITATTSKCWIETTGRKSLLYSIVVRESVIIVYALSKGTEQLELEMIKREIDECIQMEKVPPFEKFEEGQDHHDETILSHYTSSSEESFNCSSDRSVLSTLSP